MVLKKTKLLPEFIGSPYAEWASFCNHEKYLDVIFEKRIIRRLHKEMIEAKVFIIFIRVYSLFKSEQLSANTKITSHKALISNDLFAPHRNLWQIPIFRYCSACRSRFSAPLVNMLITQPSLGWTWFSKYCIFMIA
jgi:hypothetical protein